MVHRYQLILKYFILLTKLKLYPSLDHYFLLRFNFSLFLHVMCTEASKKKKKSSLLVSFGFPNMYCTKAE